MVVHFVTVNDETPSEVTWWGPNDRVPRTASGTVDAYSQQLYLESYVEDPAMGAPTLTAAEIRAQQDTRSWASRVQIPPFHRSASYHEPTGGKLRLGEQSYKNPAAFYQSPLIHVVTLQDLTQGTTYGCARPRAARACVLCVPRPRRLFAAT